MYRIIRKGELPVSRWSGGTTTQLAIWPEGAVYAERNFVWRVSSARVETQESEFTSLPGVARCLMVLDGTLHLEHEGRYETELVQFAQDNFSGSWTTRSRGRVTDFNLMTTAGEGRVQLLELGASSHREVELMPVVEAWRGVSEVFYLLADGILLVLPDGTEHRVSAGDVLVGIASSGVHSNGFSLVRKIVSDNGFELDKVYPELGERTLGEVLLTPTKIYVKQVLDVIAQCDVHGISHITGGGFDENIPRILKEGQGIEVTEGSWEILPVFRFLEKYGRIAHREMFNIFNMGIGMVIALPEEDAAKAVAILEGYGERASVIGRVTDREGVVIK